MSDMDNEELNKTEGSSSGEKKKIVVKKKIIVKSKTVSTNEEKKGTEPVENNNVKSDNKTTTENQSDKTNSTETKYRSNNTSDSQNYNQNSGNNNNYNKSGGNYNRSNTGTGNYNNNNYNRSNTGTGNYNNNNYNRSNTGTGNYNNNNYNRPNTGTGNYNNNNYNRPNTGTGNYNNNNYNRPNTGTGNYNNNYNRPNTGTGGTGNNYNRPGGNYNRPNTGTGGTGNNYNRPGGNYNRPNTGTGGFNRDGNRRFDNNRGPGGNDFNKTKPDIINTQSEKDKTRKKLSLKKDDGRKDYQNNKEDFEKIFNYRKKEKNITDAVPEKIDIVDVISISDLAKKMNLKASIIISKLMELGTMVTINDKIDADTASIVASEFNCKVNVVSLYDETVIEEEKDIESDLQKRPPIVTVMGHVDHGKTKLLDAIRQTNVAQGESGGITQHIGAYSVVLESGETITFVDTPGHEAFTMMRARGALITDIVILVVAADDGVMPQTIEAINHAKQANVPMIVAVNKIDKPDVNVDKIKQQLTEHGLLPEEWGGTTMYCNISALKKLGIKELLDSVILQAEVMDLKASYKVRPSGYVLEAKIDQGRGVVASVIILKGTLKVGDFFVAGIYSGKIRAIYNDKGKKIKQAGPSSPVEITGLEEVPNAGDPFNVTVSEKEAKMISSKRKELNRMEDAKSVKKLSFQDIFSQKKEGEVQQIKVIIKADVQGSAEAIKDSLAKLSNNEIKLITVHCGVGAVNENDVMLAVASKAIIIGFHVRPNLKAQTLADKERIEIKRYNIIYDVIEDIKSAMEGMIKPDLLEEMIGTIEIKQVFKISKVGTIAGCIVTSGKVKRKSLIRVIRDDVVIYSGKISSLKRFKDEASEVFEGMECGIGLESFKDIRVEDTMEAYEIKEIARNLEDVEKRAQDEILQKKIAEEKKIKDEELKKQQEAEAKLKKESEEEDE